MDIKSKRQVKDAQGNAAAEYPATPWYARAGSWQYGSETSGEAIEAEKKENDLKFGVPHDFSYPDPAAGNKAGDPLLPSPSNFSNNPGFMGVSTGDMATSGNPANGGTARIATPGAGRDMIRRGSLQGTNPGNGGRETWGGSTGTPANVKTGSTTGRSTMLGRGNVTMPAPGDVDPGSEGGPQIVSSGYSG